jgi:hypothetical protein
MAAPAPVWAAAPVAVPAKTTPAPAPASTDSDALVPFVTATTNPASRAETLRVLHENSWQLFSILNARIPGILIQRSVQEQLIFSPYHSCQPSAFSPKELARVNVTTLDFLLKSSQDVVAQYLQTHEAEITQLEFEDEVDAAFTPKAITVNGHYCVPQTSFSAIPAPEGQEWTMKREMKRASKTLNPALAEEPIFAKIARKPETAPVTNDEVRKLIAWIAWLREFRQSEGLYDAFHQGEGSLKALPAFTLNAVTGKKIERIQNNSAVNTANRIFRSDEDPKNPVHRLTPAMVTAAKIYAATSSVTGMPSFVSCSGDKYCFKDGSKTPVEALDEKIVLALQNPALKPGAYLDALVMLAKRTSVVEMAAVNSQLPQTLRRTTLPNACTDKNKQKGVSFLGDGVNEYEAILKTFSESSEIEWWVGQINQGIQQLVGDYHMRRALPVVPPLHARESIEFAGGRGTLYQAGQAQVKQWMTDFFKEYRSKITDARLTNRWDKLAEALPKQVDERSFADYLRHQLSQDNQNDFASILGEKMLIFFSAVRSDLAAHLTKANKEERKEILRDLLRRLVESAMGDTLMTYAMNFMDRRLFLAPGVEANTQVDLIEKPLESALILWRHRFEARWHEMLNAEGAADIQAITSSIVDQLYQTPAVQATLENKAGYETDAIARESIRENLNKALPTLEDAARAQETAEYMRTLMAWQDNGFSRFLPGGTYENALKRAMINGQFSGTESACFYAPDSKGHGKGINTFGTLNPITEQDYDHLKKALSSIATRQHKGLSKRLGALYPDAVLQKALSVANADTLTNNVLGKFNEVLEAQDAKDRGRVSAIRRNEFAPLEAWLDRADSSQAWYDARTERLAKDLFENELRPLLALRPTSGDVKGWEEYFNNRLKALFEARFPLSTAPSAAQFLALYDKSGAGDGQSMVAEVDALRAFLKGISDEGTFSKPDPKDPTPAEFVKLCTAQPDRCLGWLDTIETAVKSGTMTKLQAARIAVFGAKGLATRLKQKKPAEFTNTDRKQFTRGSWFLAPLQGELWFVGEALPKPVKPLWGSLLRTKLAAAPDAQKKSIQELLVIIDGVLAARQVEIAKANANLKAFLGQMTVEKPTVDQLQVFLSQYIAAHPELKIVETRTEHLLKLTAALRAVIKSGNADALVDAFPVFLQVVDFELKPLVTPEVMGMIQTSKADPFHAKIAKKFLPNYYDFRKKAVSLIVDVTVPQVEVTQELLFLEQKQRKNGDGSALLKHQDDTDWTPNFIQDNLGWGKKDSVDGKAVSQNAEALHKARALAHKRYVSITQLSQLLRVFGGELPEGMKALSILQKLKPHDDIFATLYADFRDTREESGFSATDILQDLNQVASMTRGTLPAVVSTARKYLQELQAYCVAGRSDAALTPTFEKAFDQVLRLDLQARTLNTGAKDRIAHMAKVPAASTFWAQFTGGKANEITDALVAADWTKLDGLLEKAKMASANPATFDATGALRAALPTALEFCSHIEAKIAAMQKELEPLAPEKETPDAFRVGYWDLVDLASGVFQNGSGLFAPLVRRTDKGVEIIGFRSAPTDSLSVKYDEFGALLGVATPALTEFLAQRPSKAILDKVWPTAFLAQAQIPAYSDADLADPIAWLNRTKQTERVRLYVRLKDYLMETMVSGNEALELAAKWAPLATKPIDPTERPVWSKRLVQLALLWQSVSQNVNIADDASKGAWKRLAQELVWTMVQGTLYRVQGDLLLAVPQDTDRKLMRETQAQIFAEKVDGKILRRWADATSAIIATAARRHSEGEAVGLPAASLEDSGATVSPEALYFDAYASLFYLTPNEETVGAEGLRWQQQYVISSAMGFHTFATQPIRFTDAWKPAGAKGTQAEDFEKWFDLVVKFGAQKEFETLRNNKDAKYTRTHLWQRHESLEKLKADPKGEYAQLMAFLKKWDANAIASTSEQTYPFFLALLNWNIRHYDEDLTLGPASERQPLLESFLGHRLVSIVHELGIELDNFEGWRRVLVEKGQPTDWFLMADNKRTVLVDVGARRFFSTAIDSAQVENPYSGATYHYRSFPVVSAEERTRGANDDGFGKWYGKTQDPRFTALHSVMEGDRPKIGGFEQLVADGLEMQGVTTVDASNPTLDDKGAPVIAKRSLYAKGRKDWDAYFSKAMARATADLTPELINEIRASVVAKYKADKREIAEPSDSAIQRIVRNREALVALRAAASELLIRYNKENFAFDLRRTDWFQLESDLNAMVQTYGRKLDYKGKIPKIDVSAWRVNERHRQGAGKAIFLGSNITFGKLFLDKSADEKFEAEAVMAAADAHYREAKQVTTYTHMLLKVSENIQKNLTALCDELPMISKITNQAEFDAAEATIWKLKLPLMDNLFEVAEELSPPGAGDGPRRMLQVMIAQHEINRENKAWWDTKIMQASGVLFVGFILASRHPAIARLAASSPGWATGIKYGMGSMNFALGGWFGWGLGAEIYEDFVTAPATLDKFSQVRDSQLKGFRPLMQDETASGRDMVAAALLGQQRGFWTWFQRGLQAAITVDMVGIPLLKFALRFPGNLVRFSRWGLAELRGVEAVATNAEKQFGEKVLSDARRATSKLGESVKPYDVLEAAKAETNLSAAELKDFEYRLQAWEADGQLVPSKPMVDALLKDVRLQIESSAKVAEVDAISMRSLNNTPTEELAEFQRRTFARLRYLKDIESKLVSSVPHVTADDLTVLLAQEGSPLTRHRPWYMQALGLPTFSADAWRLRSVWKIAAAGNDANRALSFHYLAKWMEANRGYVRAVAETLSNRAEVDLMADLLEGRLYAPGGLNPAAGEAGKRLKAAAGELRDIFRLGGLKSEPNLLDTLLRKDYENLATIYANGEKPMVLALAAAERLSPKEKAPDTLLTAVIEATELRLTEDTLLRLERSGIAFDFAPYSGYLKPRIPARVANVPVDAERVLALVEKYSSQDIQTLLGAHLKTRGLIVDSNVAEMRIASEIRRAIEVEMSKPILRPRDGGPTKLFTQMYEARLKNFEQIVNRDLSLGEAKSIIGLDANTLHWKLGDFVFKADHMVNSANSDAVEAAARMLKNFARDQRRLWKTDDLMKVMDIAPEYLQIDSVRANLLDYYGPLRIGAKMSHPEFMHISKVLSPATPVEVWEAESILGVSTRGVTDSTKESVAQMVRQRSLKLRASFGAVPNAAPNILKSEQILLDVLGL